MTTRREFTQGSLAALLLSLFSTVTFAEDVEPTTDEERLYQTLLDVRDMLAPYRGRYDLVEAYPDIAMLSVDWMLMTLCPHDPAGHTYTTKPGWMPGRQEEYVTCPHCQVTVDSIVVRRESWRQTA